MPSSIAKCEWHTIPWDDDAVHASRIAFLRTTGHPMTAYDEVHLTALTVFLTEISTGSKTAQ